MLLLQTMKTEIEYLIDRLASKELTFGCRILSNQKAGLENPYNQIEGFVYHNYGHSDWMDDEEISAIFYDRTVERSYRKNRVSERRRFGVKKNHVKVLGHDIMVGDILELMEKKKWGAGVRDLINIPNSATIIDLWAQCRTPSDVENRKTGLTKSLQEIIASTEWEEAECDEPHCKNGHYPLGMTEDGEADWGACPKCKPLEGKALFPKSPAVERLVGNLLNLDL